MDEKTARELAKWADPLTDRFVESLQVGLDLEMAAILEEFDGKENLEHAVASAIVIAVSEVAARVCFQLQIPPSLVSDSMVANILGAAMGDPQCKKHLEWNLPKRMKASVKERVEAAGLKAKEDEDQLTGPNPVDDVNVN